MEYDLQKRTVTFSKQLLVFLKTLPLTELTRNVISQVARSATSIGTNYSEANGASSKKDFRNKIHTCKKEAQESKYWLELLGEIVDDTQKTKLRALWKEAHELTLYI